MFETVLLAHHELVSHTNMSEIGEDTVIEAATDDIPQNVNFAIRSETVMKFLKDNGISYLENASARTLDIPMNESRRRFRIS